MRIEIIKVSRRFDKNYRKLPTTIKEIAEKKESIFRENPFDPRLDTHKLHGENKEIWAFSVTRTHRIKFIFINGKSVLFIEIGTHDIYR